VLGKVNASHVTWFCERIQSIGKQSNIFGLYLHTSNPSFNSTPTETDITLLPSFSLVSYCYQAFF